MPENARCHFPQNKLDSTGSMWLSSLGICFTGKCWTPFAGKWMNMRTGPALSASSRVPGKPTLPGKMAAAPVRIARPQGGDGRSIHDNQGLLKAAERT